MYYYIKYLEYGQPCNGRSQSGSYYYCSYYQYQSTKRSWEMVHVLLGRKPTRREVQHFIRGQTGSKRWILYLIPGLSDTFTPHPASRQTVKGKTEILYTSYAQSMLPS